MERRPNDQQNGRIEKDKKKKQIRHINSSTAFEGLVNVRPKPWRTR